MTAARRARHERFAAFLASRSDIELAAFVDTGRGDSVGVGGGSVILDVNGVPVFAKRIPLTDRERTHPGSTTNLFELPVFCQYGIGSPGFNAWRELTANMIVTDAVLAGETRSFPSPMRRRSHPGRRAAGRGRDPHPARTCRREDEHLLLDIVRRRHTRGIPRRVSHAGIGAVPKRELSDPVEPHCVLGVIGHRREGR